MASVTGCCVTTAGSAAKLRLRRGRSIGGHCAGMLAVGIRGTISGLLARSAIAVGALAVLTDDDCQPFKADWDAVARLADGRPLTGS